MTEPAGARAQDVGRSHHRAGELAPETAEILERYRAAMRAELEDVLGEIRPDAGQLELDTMAGVPHVTRPPLEKRRALWDLAIRARARRRARRRRSRRRAEARAGGSDDTRPQSARCAASAGQGAAIARRLTLPPPRWETPLPASVVGSWGSLVVRFAADELGIELDLWQRRAILRALAVDGSGRLVHREYLCSTARQQGKTALVRSLLGWALTTDAGPAWQLLYGIAYNRAQARIPYAAVLADLEPIARRVGHESRGGLALTRYLGIRSAMHGWRREYHTTSREARDALRGYSIDLGVFDEVRTQRDEETYAALKPTTSARIEPLIFEISSAGDERSVLLRSLWERGRRIIDGAEPAEGFGMTWYAADDDDGADDPRAWRKSSPAFAQGRMTEATIRDELRALTPSTFRRERLNLWADAADEWLPPGVWARQAGRIPAELAGRVVLGIDSEPGWSRATIAVAIANPDAPAWVGIAADLEAPAGSTVAPAELLTALDEVRATYGPGLVVWSRAAAVARHLEAWAIEADVPTLDLAPADLRKASELFRSELVGRRLEHADDPLLGVQARRARPSGPLEAGGWYFSVRESRGAIDALRAAAWAAWGVLSPEAVPSQPEIF